MKGFAGFSEGRQTTTRVPDQFFSEVLPQIDHLGELKITLYIFWLLTKKTGERRYVAEEELAADQRMVNSLPAPGMSAREALDDALERAVLRRTLLRVTTGRGAGRRIWYFVNSPKGRQAVDELLAGKWMPSETDQTIQLEVQRPNIFALYEDNIGPLTPLLSEELMEAEDIYPESWIEDAMREAVELNKRSWRYVQRILERWHSEGRQDETSRQRDRRDRRRYIEGEFADYIEH